MDKYHKHDYWPDLDGDYVTLSALSEEGRWKTCARWMIPGTWMED